MKIKVIIFSFMALGFMYLTYAKDWLYIIGALILIYLNKQELSNKN
jgi:hypothetical protein